MKPVIKISKNDIDFYLKLDKNQQICDVKPRIGTLLNFLQGRPLLMDVVDARIERELVKLSQEEIKQLREENIQRILV